MEYLDLARKYVEDRYGSDADAQTVDVLARWESVLTRLEPDPMLCARELDWVAKLKLLERYRVRDGLDWDDAKLQLVDLQYADIRPEQGALQQARRRWAQVEPHRHRRRGRRAPCTPRRTTPGPTSAAAAWRSTPSDIAAASWDSVIFDLPGRESLQRVPTIDPLRGSRAHVGALLDRCDTAEELFEALTR